MKGFQKRGSVLVGVYHVDRCYGGPEEGGWWFDAWQHVASRLVPEPQWPAIKAELLEEYPDDGRSLSSVLSRGVTEVILENQVGQFTTKERPHYE
jgi:hypothetical protein